MGLHSLLRPLAALTVLSVASVLPAFVATTGSVAGPATASTRSERISLPTRSPAAARAVAAAAAASPGVDDEARARLDEPGRRGGSRTAPPFLLLGATVDAVPTEPILVRARVAGAWTPWSELHFTADEGPDAGATTRPGWHSNPLWVGAADAYEVDAPASVPSLEVHLVGETATGGSTAAPATAGAAAAPTVAPRSAWGARAPTSPPSTTGDLKLAVVHHSASGNTYSAAEVPSVLRSIQAYHQDVQGWADFAYNFAVDRFGRTWEGRAGGIDRIVLGGHSSGFNTGSVGVVVLGDFGTAPVPAAVTDAVAEVIAWKFALHGVDPRSTVPYTTSGSSKFTAGTTVTLPRVVGHRDVQSTSCPGTQLYGKLRSIRTRVAQRWPVHQAERQSDLLAPDATGDGLVDPVEYRPGSGPDTSWVATGAGFTKRSTPVTGTYRPAVGDFDGDGRDDIFWHGPGSVPDSIWWARPTGWVAATASVGGSYLPVVGDFDANGVDDILWYGTGPAGDSVWSFQRGGTFIGRPVVQDLITGVPLVGDLDGDGADDVLWYGPGAADDERWMGTPGARRFTATEMVISGRYAPAVLDADGDGADDVLWVQPGSSTSYRWSFDGDGEPTSTTLSTPALTGTPVAGDYDGDGLEDAFVYAPGTAADAIWWSTPTGVVSASRPTNGTYATIGGPLVAGASDALLFVSGFGPDYLVAPAGDRTVSSTQVG